MIINSFRGEYGFLSNFYDCKVYYNGMTFKSSEAAYQAMKCCSKEEALSFQGHTASEAKYHGQLVKLRPDWEQVKLQIMEEIVRAKFVQNVQLAKKLVATGDAELVEGNTWGDTYWGVDTRRKKGENHLGIILMKLRSELAAVNVPQFVIRDKLIVDSQEMTYFVTAFSDEEEALAAFERKQNAASQSAYELRREYPYGGSAVWDPQTSSWIATESHY